MSKIIPSALAATLAALIVACGGGSGSSGNMSNLTPVLATGTITGFGSIYVNGVHFQTSSATIRKNGQTVAESQLAVGEVARVKGEKNDTDGTGVADSIDVDESVVGPIAAIDTTNSVVTVLGQTVKINTGTSFSMDVQPASLAGLKVGDVIRVSGVIDSSGNIVASRIERTGASAELQVLGTVASLDMTAHTFKINALVVNYSSANLTGFASGQPSDGDLVEVQGTMFDATTMTLTATHVARQQSEQEEAGSDEMEREGLITRFASATDFDVAGKPVTTSSSTVYRNGTAADLALNAKVEVEGTLNSSNVLVASVVTFHHNGRIELESTATALDATAGTLTVLGVQVTVTSTTRFEDKSATAMEKFNLSNIMVGDTVEVRGFESPAGSGKVVATRIERQPASTTVTVNGPFTAGTSPDFTVLGITIDASSATIKGLGDMTLTLADFLTQAVGHSVEVSGTLSGMTVMASEIRIDQHSERDNGDD
ncbi:MAG: hypothetical protein E6K52_11900 [Gammaproteobacteria bacterium]|nr:MAG: hypothetical protein E6K52_11900 [Gammaproteobacteria bacterium]